MNLAARARAMSTARRTLLPKPGRWAIPLILAGLALSSACSVEPEGAALSNGATPAESPTGADPTTSGTPSSPSPTPSPRGEIGYYAPGRDLVFYYADMG